MNIQSKIEMIVVMMCLVHNNEQVVKSFFQRSVYFKNVIYIKHLVENVNFQSEHKVFTVFHRNFKPKNLKKQTRKAQLQEVPLSSAHGHL